MRGRLRHGEPLANPGRAYFRGAWKGAGVMRAGGPQQGRTSGGVPKAPMLLSGRGLGLFVAANAMRCPATWRDGILPGVGCCCEPLATAGARTGCAVHIGREDAARTGSGSARFRHNRREATMLSRRKGSYSADKKEV